jgi:hypothetical protein
MAIVWPMSPGILGKLVGSELEFHRDSGHHDHAKIDGEDPRPESSRFMVALVAGPKRDGLQNDNQKRQSHGQLGKQVMESYGEREVQAVYR